MDTALEHLTELMKHSYLVTYVSESGNRDGRERIVDVKLGKAHGSSKDSLRAPGGYYAPSE